MRTCPSCGSPNVHRSRTKGWLEQVRKSLGPDRPHRCPDCRWRGWAVETAEPFQPEEPKPSVRPLPDFAVIDRAIRRSPQPSRRLRADGIFRAIDDKLKNA